MSATALVLKLALVAVVMAVSQHVYTQELEATPDKCVSLRKGQTCFQRITLTWQTTESGNFCLLLADKKPPLQCWKNARTGKLLHYFESSDDQLFSLHSHDNSLVANAKVSVAWVYKSRSRGRKTWRLF